jgi:hypothetical protein
LPFEETKKKIKNNEQEKKKKKTCEVFSSSSSESINGWMIPEGEKEQLFMSLKQGNS